jgi:hypothetical protein
VNSCHQGDPATNLIAYEGCECPETAEEPLDCSTDEPGVCGIGSTSSAVEFVVQAGKCYKLRLGNEGASVPMGQLAITCETECDPGPVTFNPPPNGVVDAGSPSDIDNPTMLKGLQEFHVMAPPGVPPGCFVLDCDTNPFGDEMNTIESVEEGPAGMYTITLARPLSPNSVTQLRYIGNAQGNPATRGRYTANHGNVDGDVGVTTDDANALIGVLDGNLSVTWGPYGSDLDRSGATTPLDLLEWTCMMIGCQAYEPNLDTFRPSAVTCPP